VTTSLKLQEICKTHTEVPAGRAKHSNAIFVFAMNPAKYNSLPPELKKVIDNNSGRETSKWVGKIWDTRSAPARKIATERHNKISVLTETEYARWVKATLPVSEDWMKEVNAKGGNGKALYNDAKAMLKKYKD
jgi:TRAP-type C4-dicarboxylate transport system substrate-binding protein